MRGTVADRLAEARRRRLVGREPELALLRRALEGSGGHQRPAVVHVHGPGGVGKTSLLDAVASLAHELDRPTLELDGGDLEPTTQGVLAALGVPTGGPATLVSEVLAADAVVLLDRFEALAPVASWLWRQVVPRLPADALLVVAGRHPPPESWRTDPAWPELAREVALRNLAPADALRLLEQHGVRGPAGADLVRATHGHPLALVIAAELTDRAVGGGDPGADQGAAPAGGGGRLLAHPDAAARLLGRFLDDVADDDRRRALQVCAHARRVDRAMLQAVLVVDAPAADHLLDWLRRRPYVESHADGLGLHDVVRDALDHDLRWRDRDAFADLHRRIRAVVVARMSRREGAEQQRAASDLLYLHRGNPLAERLYALDALGSVTTLAAGADDHDDVAGLFDAVDGPARGAAVRHWLRTQPGAFHLHLDGHGVAVGAVGMLRLDRCPTVDPTVDPVAASAIGAAARRRPPEEGEVVLHQPVADALTPDRPGPVSDAVAMLSLREWAVPRLGWVTLASSRTAKWTPVWAYIGFEPLGSVSCDGVEVAVWGRDFGRSPTPSGSRG